MEAVQIGHVGRSARMRSFRAFRLVTFALKAILIVAYVIAATH